MVTGLIGIMFFALYGVESMISIRKGLSASGFSQQSRLALGTC